MIEEKITYFEGAGKDNTRKTLELAVKTAKESGIKNLVIASTEGNSAKMLADEIDWQGINVTVVTHAYGQKTPNTNPMSEDTRKYLKEKGFNICTAAHVLSGAERSLSRNYGGIYPVEIIAYTLRMFGQGTKVCVEISSMAADAGYISTEEPVVAVGGTISGADTAVVLRPEVTSRIIKTKIDRIICKPIEL